MSDTFLVFAATTLGVVTVARRAGGRPPKLSREAVLDAARSLHPRHVTLAAVGGLLGVTSPALYRYFPDRAAILEALAAEARDRLVPPAVGQPWDEWLRAAARMERDLWRRHSDLYLLADFRVSAAPLAQMIIVGLEVLTGAGIEPADAMAALTVVTETAHAIGHAEASSSSAAPYPDEMAARLRTLLGEALPTDLDALLERSLDITVDGLRRRNGC